MLGVQSKNNEGMRFKDRASFSFLLHFWSYVAQIYLPIQVDAKDKVKLHGYAIAIPDIHNLSYFCKYFPSILQQRSTKVKWGKPDGAIVRYPIEAGIVFLRSIHTYLDANVDDTDISDLLFGVDVFHVFKQKDEPQILSIHRYPSNKESIEEFDRLEHKIFDPIFRLQYWENLIGDRSRISGFDKLLWDLPLAKTIGNKWFCRDFRTLFNSQSNPMESAEIDLDPTNDSAESIESSVLQEISLVKQGLTGENDRPRYGFPFAGDNCYLFDRIDCLDEPLPSHWFVSIDSILELEPGAVSLTVEIDRHAPSKTKSLLFSATKDSLTSLPDPDWLSMFESKI
jgi:CRISPR-associated protein Cmx8